MRAQQKCTETQFIQKSDLGQSQWLSHQHAGKWHRHKVHPTLIPKIPPTALLQEHFGQGFSATNTLDTEALGDAIVMGSRCSWHTMLNAK